MIRQYRQSDIPEMIRIWNEVVEEGIAFPQEECLDPSYAVSSDVRGQHIGEKLVMDCLKMARTLGFRVLQFNAVVESNIHARHLYERLGFIQLGTIPGGFRMKDGHYENICPYYHTL